MTRVIRAMLVTPLVTALAITLAACSAPGGTAGRGRGGGTEQVWRSDGYGWVYALRGDQLRIFDITEISCLPEEPLERIGGSEADGALRFGSDGEVEQTLRPGQDGRAVAHVVGAAADVDLLPLPEVPQACTRQSDDDPLTTFDVFWATFAENYNSFETKKIDWAAVRDRYRPQVTDDTSSRELFETMRAMIEPFGDTHTEIQAGDDRDFEGLRPGTRELPVRATSQAVDNRLRALGATELRSFAQGAIVYTDLPDGRGYLRINSFEDYDEDDDSFQASNAILTRALDAVFTPQRVAAMRALVIDVRNNSGGDDPLALAVAARLTDRSYLAYTKAARNDPKDQSRYSRAQPVTVTPADGPRYTGPVHLLISDMTVSAGETFVLGMMGRAPQPTRIGTTTQGVFADTLERELPNGWTISLGNERYLSPDGKSYEGLGIPPTIETPVFTAAELAAGQDPALEATR